MPGSVSPSQSQRLFVLLFCLNVGCFIGLILVFWLFDFCFLLLWFERCQFVSSPGMVHPQKRLHRTWPTFHPKLLPGMQPIIWGIGYVGMSQNTPPPSPQHGKFPLQKHRHTNTQTYSHTTTQPHKQTTTQTHNHTTTQPHTHTHA